MKKIIFIIIVGVVGLEGCGNKSDLLHIGSKKFTEQIILTEIVAQLCEYENIPVKRSIPYGDTFLCLESLKSGELDIYVEYTGTALSFLGQASVSNGDQAFSRVKELFNPLGLQWYDAFGFNNTYTLIMRKDRAAALHIKSISDLRKLSSGVRFAAGSDFKQRPVDGLFFLLRRYGLTKADYKEIDSKSDLYNTLLINQADVVVGFSTDAYIKDYGLRVLEDDLGFFSSYEPCILIRKATLDRFPDLDLTLKKLSGTIDQEKIQQMNRAVEVEGESYREVAGRFLAKQGLISEDNIGQSEKSHLEKLVLSIGILDELVGYGGKAFRAVRKVFPKRRVKIFRTSEPLQELIHGKARLAYTGVESFFQISENGLPIQIKFAEAIGAVGYRMCHIIALRDNGLTRLTDMKKIGVGIKNGTSHKTANILLTALGLKDKIQIIYGELTTQVEDLKQKKIDGIVLMTRLGHEKIISLLNQGIFKIIPFQEWQKESNSVRFPFFRISKIPAKTYANQLKDIETIGAQTVLAGISHPQQNIGDVGMPAVPTKAQPLSDNTILRLVEELGVDEKIDPTIPSANILKPKQEIISKTIQADYPSTAANGLIILVLICLFYLFFQEEKPTK